MPFYLGIDGGQSSTIALIGDESGRVLGEGQAGPCNHVGASERRAKFIAAIGDSVGEALRKAGLREAVFAAVCAGFSGGSADKEALTRELIRADRYLITHDAHVALAGATGGAPGVITIAGTGSIAYGRNAEGRIARAGGWGYVFGDEGSAFDIVRQAVRAIVRQEEGWGPATQLREPLLAAAKASSANELLHRFYTEEFPRERIASLAHLAGDAAASGDNVAAEVLSAAAQSLATITAAVRRQLFKDDEEAPVYYAGGVFSNEPLLARFRLLIELDGSCRLAAPKYSPAQGALIESYRI